MPKFKAKLYCIAFNCRNNNRDRTLSFFTLPKDMERRRQWLILVGRQDLIETETEAYSGKVVCSAHFDESTFKIIRHLKEDALPTKLLPDPSEGMLFVTSQVKEEIDTDTVAAGTQTEKAHLTKSGDPLKTDTKKRKVSEKPEISKKIESEDEVIVKEEKTVEIEIELSPEKSAR